MKTYFLTLLQSVLFNLFLTTPTEKYVSNSLRTKMMRSSFIFFLICTAFNLDGNAMNSETNDAYFKICKSYMDYKTSPSRQTGLDKIFFQFQHLYFRGGLIEAQISNSKNENEVIIEDQADKTLVTNEAYLFSSELNTPMESLAQADKKENRTIAHELNSMKRKLVKEMSSTKNVDDCILKLKKINYDAESFIEKMDSYPTNEHVTQVQNFRSAVQVQKINKYLRARNWYVDSTANYQEIFLHVQSSRVKINLLLALHADHLGRLYDSVGNIFPKSYFYSLKDNINSLTIFSCYSKSVLDYYFNKDDQTDYPIISPKLTSYAEKYFKDTMPASYFKKFHSEIQRKKYTSPAFISTKNDSPQCRIKLHGNNIGGLEIYLNSKLIGFTGITANVYILFKTSLLNEKNNIIIKSSSQIISNHSREVSYALECNNNQVIMNNLKIYEKDGILMSYKGEFDGIF